MEAEELSLFSERHTLCHKSEEPQHTLYVGALRSGCSYWTYFDWIDRAALLCWRYQILLQLAIRHLIGRDVQPRSVKVRLEGMEGHAAT